jgi:hypothetical protein
MGLLIDEEHTRIGRGRRLRLGKKVGDRKQRLCGAFAYWF